MIGYKPNGKPDYKSVYGKTKKEAKDKLKKFLDDRAAGIWFEHHQDNITATVGQPKSRACVS